MKIKISLLLILISITLLYAEEIAYDPLLNSDLNADGRINILDLVFVASQFSENVEEYQYPNPDVNRDGSVNRLDLTLIANHFGEYSGIPIRLTDETFDSVLRSVQLPILIEFESDYCFYCFLMRPTVARIALENRDTFHVAKIEINQNPLKTAEYHIQGTPTYILFYEGNIIETIRGAMPREKLLNRILNALTSVVDKPLEQE